MFLAIFVIAPIPVAVLFNGYAKQRAYLVI